MTETTNNGLQVIDQEQFGQLIELPEILTKNKLSATNAKAATDAAINLIPPDLKTADLAATEKTFAGLNALRVKLDTTLTTMDSRRKPKTQFFDLVKSMFTTEEKKVQQCIDNIKVNADAWEREKARRASESTTKLADDIAKKQEAIDITANIRKIIQYNFTTALAAKVQKANDIFNSQTIKSLPTFETNAKTANPSMKDTEWAEICNIATSPAKYYTASEVLDFDAQVRRELYTPLGKQWLETLTGERDRIVDLIPSRMHELQTIEKDASAKAEADARIAKENAERANNTQQAIQHATEQTNTQAEADKLNATFEVASTAELAPTMAKGTVKKLKYNPTTHAAHIAILQSWVANELPSITVMELNTKLSFMRTAANKRLNDGVKLQAEGLQIEEDFSTRATKVK